MLLERALPVTAEQVKQVQEYHNVTPERIKEDIEILKEWLKKQPHLPQDIEDGLFERFLLRNKFRIERTKEKIECFYTIRGQHREYYTNYQEIVPTELPVLILYLPQLTPKCHRVILLKLNALEGNFEDIHFMNIARAYLLYGELAFNFDYNLGLHFVVNCENFEVNYFFKINPSFLFRTLKLLEKAYSAQLRGIHFINAPAGIAIILNALKKILPPKFFEKIQVHNDLDTLYKEIPQEIFPKEYGGVVSLQEMLELWNDVLLENQDFFEKNLTMVSDESKRIDKVDGNDMFGTEGTFRTINLD